MEFENLVKATLIKRYKRFLADVVLANGDTVTVYCPNTGAMTGCAEPGVRVWLSQSDNAKRKYRYTWELLETHQGHLVCIHSARANGLAIEAIRAGVISELANYDDLATEVPYGNENSRIDIRLTRSNKPRCYVEVKSVTLLAQQNLGLFPDAPSQRGQKHLRELTAMAERGERAVLLFCVLHSGIKTVSPSDAIDPVYGSLLRNAVNKGVEVLVYRASISPQEMRLVKPLPFCIT